jgi:hypothetical protein
MCFVCLSEQTVTFALYNINILVFITGVEGVFCAVRTEFLYNTGMSRPLKVNECAMLHGSSDKVKFF